MSATRRKGHAPREAEFYPTPAWCVDALLRAIPDLPGGLWVEPAVGNGAIVRAVEAARPFWQNWVGFDVRPEAISACCERIDRSKNIVGAFFVNDFLALPDGYPAGAQVFITNPPFSLAEAFARACLARAGKTGIVIMLLRLAFLESGKRVAFHREHPADIYPLARRPSFTDGSATDSTAYAWWVWGPGRGGRWHTPIGADGDPRQLDLLPEKTDV